MSKTQFVKVIMQDSTGHKVTVNIRKQPTDEETTALIATEIAPWVAKGYSRQ